MLSGESIIAPQEKEESSMKESRRKQIESLLASRWKSTMSPRWSSAPCLRLFRSAWAFCCWWASCSYWSSAPSDPKFNKPLQNVLHFAAVFCAFAAVCRLTHGWNYALIMYEAQKWGNRLQPGRKRSGRTFFNKLKYPREPLIQLQERSARDFVPNWGLEIAGILCVPARGMPHP